MRILTTIMSVATSEVLDTHTCKHTVFRIKKALKITRLLLVNLYVNCLILAGACQGAYTKICFSNYVKYALGTKVKNLSK